ncbi:MAG: zinc ribbon domain-containing protein [Gemmatimonadetes bacterium]|nr:MAG: zinc ribbon domain-containing protein [Gemmatimonadota bacterium]
MPIYEYELIEGTCDVCPGRFEARQWMKDEPLAVCPRCQKPVRRLISRVAIHRPTTATDLKSQGMTRLVRRDKGVYEIEGANSGIVDLSRHIEAQEQHQADENVYDLSDYAPADVGSPPDMEPKQAAGVEAPLKRQPDTKFQSLPFYDMTRVQPDQA